MPQPFSMSDTNGNRVRFQSVSDGFKVTSSAKNETGGFDWKSEKRVMDIALTYYVNALAKQGYSIEDFVTKADRPRVEAEKRQEAERARAVAEAIAAKEQQEMELALKQKEQQAMQELAKREDARRAKEAAAKKNADMATEAITGVFTPTVAGAALIIAVVWLVLPFILIRKLNVIIALLKQK
jgi:Fe2+ transport system protein B